MRASLILVLLCSVAQLADSADSIKDGCGGIYVCYVPQMCLDESKTTIATSAVQLVTKTDKVTDDCPALFKFYGYAKHFMHVWMESFSAASHIEFIHTDGRIEKTKFSCKKAGQTFEGFYQSDKRVTHHNVQQTDNLRCEFKVKLSPNKKVIETSTDDEVQINVDADSTDATRTQLYITGCDPTNIANKQEMIDPRKMYAKVTNFPIGQFRCADPLFKMEFRAEGAEDYKEAVLTCEGSTFRINGGKQHGSLDLRCFAPAKYFCNDLPIIEDVSGEGSVKLERIPPIPGPGDALELKCPPGHYLYFKGKPMLNKNIECLVFGVKATWTIDQKPLKDEIHCENKIKCNLLHKIKESSVQGGFIGTDYLPKCVEKGTMTVDGKEVTNLACDPNTGDFTYTTGGVTQRIEANTKFICNYPDDDKDAKAQDAESVNKITKWSTITGILVLVAILAIILGFVIFLRMRLKKERMEAEAINKAAFLTYGSGKKEKKQELKKKKKSLPNQPDEPEDLWTFNPYKMSIRYSALHALKKDNTKEEKMFSMTDDKVGEKNAPTGNEEKTKILEMKKKDAHLAEHGLRRKQNEALWFPDTFRKLLDSVKMQRKEDLKKKKEERDKRIKKLQ